MSNSYLSPGKVQGMVRKT